MMIIFRIFILKDKEILKIKIFILNEGIKDKGKKEIDKRIKIKIEINKNNLSSCYL